MKILLFALTFVFAAIGGAAAAPADGTWEVRLPNPGRGCPSSDAEWILLLTVAQGGLSGVLNFPGKVGWLNHQTIENFVLNPDGSFTGTTSGWSSGRPGTYPPLTMFSVSGQFSGNTATAATTARRPWCHAAETVPDKALGPEGNRFSCH